MSSLQECFSHLPPEASRLLFVSDLPPLSNDDYYRFFGQFGKLRDLRLNDVNTHTPNDLRHGFLIFDDILDAVRAFEQLTDFLYQGQLIKVRFFTQSKPIVEFDAALASLGK